ncbi:MAG: stage II sporulation protein M [Nanobdellota archaeon]
MTFEMLFSDKTLLKKPFILAFISFISGSIGIILSIFIFPGHSSIIAVTFTIIPLIPIFVKLIENQEKIFEKDKRFKISHTIIMPMTYMFIGLILANTFWFTLLPDMQREEIFEEQINGIYDLKGPFGFAVMQEEHYEREVNKQYSCLGLGVDNYKELGIDKCFLSDYNKNGEDEIVLASEGEPKFVIKESGNRLSFNNFIFQHIFFNNFGVLIFIFLTSFIFGAGSIFILAWNASIIGVFIGDSLHRTANFLSGKVIFAYLIDIPRIVGPLLVHGVFEFAGFFCAAIAGGVISVAILKNKVNSKPFAIVMKDGFELMLLSVLLILIGALLESYV